MNTCTLEDESKVSYGTLGHGSSSTDAQPFVPFDPADFEVERSADGDIDLSLIDHCLSMSPWERALANDDMLNFVEMLQQSMHRHHASA